MLVVGVQLPSHLALVGLRLAPHLVLVGLQATVRLGGPGLARCIGVQPRPRLTRGTSLAQDAG